MPTVTVQGLPLEYLRSGAGLSRPPLLLINGLGHGFELWRWMLPLLTTHFEVIAPNNRGIGDSLLPEGALSTRSMAADAAGLLDALGVPSAQVLGLSLGGFVAQELALGWPERVERLVLMATSPGGAHALPVTPEALAVMTDASGTARDHFERGLGISTTAAFQARHPDRVQALWEDRLAKRTSAAGYRAQVAAGAGHAAGARLGQLRCPTLALTGSEDRVVPPGNAARLAALIPGAQHRVMAGAGHLLPAEAPEACAREVIAFCSRPKDLPA